MASPLALEKLLPVSRWTTADEARASRWFSPVRVGPMRVMRVRAAARQLQPVV